MALHHVPRDVWNMIAQDLGLHDLLALRATCQRLNAVVIGMQSRWYRAHQWFLIRKSNVNKVKSAVRVHTRALTAQCVPDDFNYPGRLPSHAHQYYLRYDAFTKVVQDGLFREEDCKRNFHWTWKVPNSELDIPLDKNFKPKRSNYIYYYLIECYKHKASARNTSLVQCSNFIESCEKEIASLETRLAVAKQERDRMQASKDQNDIFSGYAVNSYKTPAGTTTVRAKPTKRAKVAAAPKKITD